MKIFPAIDLYDGKAVRLLRGEYNKMTVYADRPYEKAESFFRAGAGLPFAGALAGAFPAGGLLVVCGALMKPPSFPLLTFSSCSYFTTLKRGRQR